MSANQIAQKILEHISEALAANRIQEAEELSRILSSVIQAREAGL